MLNVNELNGFGFSKSKEPVVFVTSAFGSALSNNDTSVTITGHRVGDLLLAVGSSANTATEPTFTAGWNFIHQFYSPSLSQRIAIHVWRFADTDLPITLNFTNTGTVSGSVAASGILVFRNAIGIGNTVVKTNYSGSAVSSIAVPTLALQKTDGSSAVALTTHVMSATNISACTSCSISNGWAFRLGATSFTGATATVNAVQSILGVVEILGEQ